MGESYDVDPDEFTNWIHPKDALALFKGVDSNTAMTSIAHRIQDGYIRTAVRRATFRGKDKREYFVLPPAVWKDWAFLNYDPVWDVGDTVIFPYLGSGQTEIRIYDLRLDPEGLKHELSHVSARRPAPEPQSPPQPSPEATQPDSVPSVGTVGRRELIAWAKAYLASRPGLVHDQIAEAAKVHFAPRKVTRQPLRDAIKSASYPVKAGNPSIRRKSVGE